MSQKIAGVVLAWAVTIFAGAGEVSAVSTTFAQTFNAGSSQTGLANPDMSGFLTVVSAVMGDSNFADDYDNREGSESSALGRSGPYAEHLGLGIGLGMSNDEQHNDECHGNGLAVRSDSAGNPGCGDPSPSD